MIKIKEKNVDDGRFGFFPGSSVLLSPFAKILSGILIAGLLTSSGFALLKTFEVKDLKIELLTEQKENSRLQSEIDKCRIELENQNRAIEQLLTDSQRDIEEMNKVNDELNKMTEKQRKEINNLKNIPAPESCEESMEWLRDNMNIFGGNE